MNVTPPKDLFRTTAPEMGDPEDLALRRIARALGTRAWGTDSVVLEGDAWKALDEQLCLEVRIYNDTEFTLGVRRAGSKNLAVPLAPGVTETFPVVANASEIEVSRYAVGEKQPSAVAYRWRNG